EIRAMTVGNNPGQRLTPNFKSMAFSPSGDRLAALCEQENLEMEQGVPGCVVWDVASGERRCFIKDEVSTTNVTALAFSADGKLLYTAGAQGYVWDAARDDRVKSGPVRVSVPGMLPLEMVCSPTGDRFATLWSDGKPPHPNGPIFSAGEGPKIELRVG